MLIDHERLEHFVVVKVNIFRGKVSDSMTRFLAFVLYLCGK